MRARAVNQHVEARVQPEVDLDADAVIKAVRVPAQRQQILPGAGKKLLLAQGDMVFTPRVRRAGNVPVRDQQL